MTQAYPLAPVCAVGAIVFRGSAVLLVQRAKPPAQGKWSIPGGVVQLGETLEEAVIREFREEVQLEVRPLQVGKVLGSDPSGCCWAGLLSLRYRRLPLRTRSWRAETRLGRQRSSLFRGEQPGVCRHHRRDSGSHPRGLPVLANTGLARDAAPEADPSSAFGHTVP